MRDTAIRTEQTGHKAVALNHVLTRGLFIILGCSAICWAVVVLPAFLQQSSAEHIAKRIIAGDPFKPATLVEQLAALAASENSGFCRPVALQSAAIIQLRVSETAAGGAIKSGENLNSLDGAVRNSLSCAPADPFLWLILFAVQNAKKGYIPENLKYLRMSYLLGPNEGWILERRNPVVLAELEWLPADLSAKAINEFIRLLDDRFYRRAVNIFCATTGPARDAILSKMGAVPLRTRKSFARSVYDCGLDVEVPGVKDDSPKRPW
jgi:hypothetical protein